VQAVTRRKVSGFLLILPILVFCGSISDADEDWVIREDGVGQLAIGMTLSQVNKTLREKFTLPADKDNQPCFYVKTKRHQHIAFMIEDGRLTRMDVDAPGIFTVKHIQVGDSEARAMRAHGQKLKVEPQHFIDGGHYLTIRSSNGRFGVRFETEKGKITNYYAGEFTSVQYEEGCQ